MTGNPVYLTIRVRVGESIQQWCIDQWPEPYVRNNNVLTASTWQIKLLNSRNGDDCALVRVQVWFDNNVDLMLFKLRWE